MANTVVSYDWGSLSLVRASCRSPPPPALAHQRPVSGPFHWETKMHKTHTLPNAARGCVVFGPLTGRAKPRAGLFTKAAIGDIADAAHIAGLATMDLSSVAMRAVHCPLQPCAAPD